MTQRIISALTYTDETAALVALPEYTAQGDNGPQFRMDICDPNIPVMVGTGTYVTDPDTGQQVEVMERAAGYYINITAYEALVDKVGFIGAWEYGVRNPDGTVVLIAGTAPKTPARDFAA